MSEVRELTELEQRFRPLIGLESEPVTVEIEKGMIRRFAEAIGDLNPLYVDEEAARASNWGALIAPPTFPRSFGIEANLDNNFSWGSVRLHAGHEYELHRPIKAGDRITARNKVVDVYEKSGRSGRMLFIITEARYTNQDGDLVAICRRTHLNRE